MVRKLRGNAKGCLVYEPLFIIPYSLFITYASVYMLALGLDETKIGIITSLGLFVQIIASIFSGYLTDRLGRRSALWIFDVVSWSVATLIWAISQNFWFFVVAAVVNSFQKVPHIAWNCLLVEDTEPKDRSYVFTVLQFISIVGGLFAPLGGLLVSHFTLVPAVRIMYIIACISMTIMVIARHFATHETEIGIRKKQEVSEIKFKEAAAEYIDGIKSIYKNRPLLLIFIVYILFNFQITMQQTYLSIYLVDRLQISDTMIGIFPAVSSVCMLVLLIYVVPRLNERYNNRYIMLGFGLSILASLLIIVSAPKAIAIVILSTILSACGLLFSSPYLESTVANSIDDDRRANLTSILQVFVLVFISPAGIIGGLTYKLDPRIPFLLIILSLLISISVMIVLSRKTSDENHQQVSYNS